MTKRVAPVFVAALAVAGLAAVGQYGWALAIGMVAGAVLFLVGVAGGGGLGNARRVGQAPADTRSRIGVCLAAEGIAASAVGNPHFPSSFHIFYGACLVVAAVGAVALAFRAARAA